MSQAGELDVVKNHPNIPTMFTANSGMAIPLANNLNIYGADGITTTASGDTITIHAVNGTIIWKDISASQAAVAGEGYFCTGPLTLTMPVGVLGNTIYVVVLNASTVTLQAISGQEFIIGSDASSVAGTCKSNAIGDAVKFVYSDGAVAWVAPVSPQGIWSLA